MQALEDFAARQSHRRRAQPPHHLAAQPGHADLEALEVLQRLDFAVEPAAHLDAGIVAAEGLDLEFRRQFVPQLLSAAIVEPGVHLGGIEAEGHGGEEVEALGLALPVIFRTVIHIGGAGGDGVEGFEGGHQLSSRVHLDVEFAFGRFADPFGKAFRGRAQTGKILGPGGDQLERPLALGIGGGGDGGACGQTGGRAAFQKCPAIHRMILPEFEPGGHAPARRNDCGHHAPGRP